jgi:hypothetical protein
MTLRRTVRSLLLIVALTATLLVGGFSVHRSRAAAAPPTTNCAYIRFFGLAGSGELDDVVQASNSQFMGATVYSVYSRFKSASMSAGVSIDGYGVSYPAVNVPNGMLNYGQNYIDSESKGVSMALQAMENAAKACPAQQFILAGYSQGANVIDDLQVQMPLAVHGRVLAYVKFGDPYYDPTAPAGNIGPTGAGANKGILAQLTGYAYPIFGDDASKTESYCHYQDIVCQGYISGISLKKQLNAHAYRNGDTSLAARHLSDLEPPISCHIAQAAIQPPTWVPGIIAPGITVSTSVLTLTAPYPSGLSGVYADQIQWKITDPNYRLGNIVDALNPLGLEHSEPLYNSNVAGVPLLYDRSFYALPTSYQIVNAVPKDCGSDSRITAGITKSSDGTVHVTGRLTSGKTGRPLSNASLYLNFTDPYWKTVGWFPGLIDETDDNGYYDYELTGLLDGTLDGSSPPPGTYSLQVSYAGDLRTKPSAATGLKFTYP